MGNIASEELVVGEKEEAPESIEVTRRGEQATNWVFKLTEDGFYELQSHRQTYRLFFSVLGCWIGRKLPVKNGTEVWMPVEREVMAESVSFSTGTFYFNN